MKSASRVTVIVKERVKPVRVTAASHMAGNYCSVGLAIALWRTYFGVQTAVEHNTKFSAQNCSPSSCKVVRLSATAVT